MNEEQLEAWNAAHPAGTRVEFKMDGGGWLKTTTLSRAVSEGRRIVVRLAGINGWVDVRRVKGLKEEAHVKPA